MGQLITPFISLVWLGFFNWSKVSLKLFYVSAHHVLTWEVDSCTAIAVGQVISGAWGLYALTPAAKMCGAFLLQHAGQVNKPKAHILFALIMTLLSKCIKLGYQNCRVHCNERHKSLISFPCHVRFCHLRCIIAEPLMKDSSWMLFMLFLMWH